MPSMASTTAAAAKLEMSGQEMLPVLKLADGSTVNGGANIANWAKANAPAHAGQSVG